MPSHNRWGFNKVNSELTGHNGSDAQYQRTSSAVEGRNGYLSGLHQAGRGLSQQTLRVLTIIHNFDLKRADDTTAAQRLFNHHFPDLFEWVVDHRGELPVARRSSKAQPANPSWQTHLNLKRQTG